MLISKIDEGAIPNPQWPYFVSIFHDDMRKTLLKICIHFVSGVVYGGCGGCYTPQSLRKK